MKKIPLICAVFLLFVTSCEKKEDPMAKYNREFKEMVAHFEAIEAPAREKRRQELQDADDRYKEACKKSEDEARRANAANALAALKEQGRIEVELANERVRLAGIEKQIAMAKGDQSRKLLELQADSANRIRSIQQQAKNRD